jgi:S-adenosylhomocysteine hydrolase
MPPVEKLLIPLFRGIRTLSANANGVRHVIQPHPIPNLPVMNELEQRAKNFLFRSQLKPPETAVVGAQHLLETTSTLFQKLRNLGFEVYATGKCYSTSPSVYEAMSNMGVHVWPGSKPERLGEYQSANEKDVMTVLREVEKNPSIRNIVFLDDGGRFFERMPPHFRRKYRVGGVEQTRAGFYSRNVEAAKIPIVNAAQSAAKLLLESPFIADAAVEQISAITQQLDKEKCVVGIIGFGAIGRALVEKLIKDGFQVAIFDKDPETYNNFSYLSKIEIMRSIEQLFMHTNFIIGCTGQDNTESFDPLTLNGHDRMIASVSSEDKEFKSLLRSIASQSVLKADPLSTIECYTKSGNIIEILYGGFPVNFAQSALIPFNVPAAKIALTQGILFASIMQVLELMEKNSISGLTSIPTNVMLDPILQQKVVEIWYRTTIKENGLSEELIQKFLTNRDWVSQSSKGTYYPSEICGAICKPIPPNAPFIKANL